MSVENFGYRQELKRGLTLRDLVIYGLVFLIPISPFGIYGFIHAESKGMVPLAFLIGMVAMLFTALSYRQMAKAFPIAGSVYSYAQRGLYEHVGFIAGWVLLLDYLLIPSLLYIFSALALHHYYPGISKAIWMLLFLIGATLVNFRGSGFSAKVNKLLLIGELIVLALFLFFGFKALSNGMGNGALTFSAFYNPNEFNISLIMKATSVAVLAFLGFDAISTLAEEVKGDPRSQIGQATLITLFLAGGMFVLQTWLATDLAVGMTFISLDSAFYEIAGAAGGEWLGILTAVATAISWGIGVSIVAQAAVSRLLFSMARDGNLPKVLAHVHPNYRTPHISLLLVAMLSLIISNCFMDHPDLLATLVNFGALIGFSILHVSVINHYILRQRSRNWINHLIIPLIGLLIVLYVLINMSANAIFLGASWIVLGLIYMFILISKGKKIEISEPT
ncbi:APC family permease [Pseudomonas kurunegalensis]|uniref:APC family permease n=1 Tax=Pseudomonas kurunegalensis TaxID=485880 RepID=UPI003261B7B8